MANDHDFSDETLISYARGRLDTDTHAAVELSAKTNARLAAEIALTRGLITLESTGESSPHFNDFGWARLSRAIDQTTRAAPLRARFSIWQIALAASLAIVAWQFGAIPLLKKVGADGAIYEMAGAAPATPFSAQVTFVPDIRESQLRAALLAADAQIGSGPSALGVYDVKFRDQASLKAGVERLRLLTGVVESIQEN